MTHDVDDREKFPNKQTKLKCRGKNTLPFLFIYAYLLETFYFFKKWRKNKHSRVKDEAGNFFCILTIDMNADGGGGSKNEKKRNE